MKFIWNVCLAWRIQLNSMKNDSVGDRFSETQINVIWSFLWGISHMIHFKFLIL